MFEGRDRRVCDEAFVAELFGARREEVVHRLARQSGEGHAEQLFGLRIHEDDLPLGIDDAEPVAE